MSRKRMKCILGKIKNSCPLRRHEEPYLRYRLCKEDLRKINHDLKKSSQNDNIKGSRPNFSDGRIQAVLVSIIFCGVFHGALNI
jgi:hypothetical protein